MGLGEREKRAGRGSGPSGWMALRCDVGASGHNRHTSQDMDDQAVDSVWTASTSSIRRASCCACARRL